MLVLFIYAAIIISVSGSNLVNLEKHFVSINACVHDMRVAELVNSTNLAGFLWVENVEIETQIVVLSHTQTVLAKTLLNNLHDFALITLCVAINKV
jgi:hypothetical protein